MPELRQNLATKEWVVIAPERGKGPENFRQDGAPAKGPERVADCPFCPGNEAQTEGVLEHAEGGRWRVRVLRNKYPALVPNAPRVEAAPGSGAAKGNLYRRLPGEGTHEVIVESPHHSQALAQMSREQAREVISVYQERFRAISKDMKIAMTLLFKNHGAAAGTTLEHPHSQIVGSSVVPSHVRHRMDEAQKYYEQNNECVICRMLEEEKAQASRVVVDSQYFCAFVLFAALSPFHLWIVPKRHTPGFGEITSAEADDLAATLQAVLRKLQAALGDPSYNFVIQSIPQDRGTTEAFHWYLSLVVRLGKAAGFELGSGMYINTVLPEEAARLLKSVKA